MGFIKCGHAVVKSVCLKLQMDSVIDDIPTIKPNHIPHVSKIIKLENKIKLVISILS